MKLGVDLQIAIAASTAEMKFQRMLGASTVDQHVSSLAVLDEVLDIASAPDKPHVTMPMRKIGNPLP